MLKAALRGRIKLRFVKNLGKKLIFKIDLRVKIGSPFCWSL